MKNILILMFLMIRSNCQCQYLDYILNIDDSNYFQNYTTNTTLDQSYLDGINNIGFGMWMKYQPFRIYVNGLFDPIPLRDQFFEGKLIQRKNEKFLLSITQNSLQSSQLILSLIYQETTQKFQILIYTNFINSQENYTWIIDPDKIEGRWFMFYIFLNTNLRNSQIGLYNLEQQTWQIYKIQDIPQLSSQIMFHMGGASRILQYQQQLWLFEKFYGIIITMFQTQDNLLENDIGNCQEILQFIHPCFGTLNYLVTLPLPEELQGNHFFTSYVPYASTDSFIIYGWVKLDNLKENQRETLILRVTMSSNYNDDENFGDRIFYLKYYQNQIPELNGLYVSTQSYDIPIAHKYKSQESDIIRSFDEDYQKLLIKWHIIQFEQGTLNNHGFPMFTLYFPQLGSYSLYWNKKFKYFTQPTLYFYLGGDKYSKNQIKGNLQEFYYQELCEPIASPIFVSCHQSCETCDGPTSNSCLTCSQNSLREFDQQTQSCNCPANFLSVYVQSCMRFDELGVIVEGKISNNMECELGYIEIDTQCIQCPYYEQFKSKTFIKCADCYIDSKQFNQTLSCTYDYIPYEYNKNYAYTKYQRNQDEIESFKIDKKLNKLIKLPIQQFYYQIICQKQQILKQNQCVTIDHCKTFEFQDTVPINCQTCDDGYYLSDNFCIKCGDFCKYCNSFGLCNYCEEPSQYFLTFDGKNCKICEIPNCDYCFQYYYDEDQIISTLDFKFQIKNLSEIQIFDGCALCQENYFFNFQTNLCEPKCQNIIQEQGKLSCKQTLLDCYFGIVDNNNNIYCIYSHASVNSIIYEKCSQINNCQQCINSQFLSNEEKCVVCKKGYYLEIQTRQCFQCPNECTTCFQQSNLFNDYWKQQVYGFYYLIFNSQGKYFENNAINIHQRQEIICLECLSGYILYNGICIKDCDSSCKQCMINEGKATCIQCSQNFRGYMRAKSSNDQCIECPNGCSACTDRSLTEILDYNPSFVLTQQNIFQTRKCFEVFDDQQQQNNLLIDQQNMIVVQCQDQINCMDQMAIYIDIYCDYKDLPFNQHFIWYIQTIKEAFFTHRKSFEDVPEEILIKLSTQQLNIYCNLISNESFCDIEDGYSISTEIQKRIFSLKSVNLYLIGSKPNTLLIFENVFKIENYKSVTFKNLILQFYNKEEKQSFQIQINSLSKFLSLIFENCTFTSKDIVDKRGQQISFLIDKPYNLILKNVNFINLYLSNSILFTTSVCNKINLNIILENILFENILFENFTFIKLFDTKQQIYKLNITQMVISNSIFSNSSMIWVESETYKTDSSIYFNKIDINTSLFTKSLIFHQPQMINFIISQMKIQNSNFSQNTLFISTQNIDLSDIILTTIQNKNSMFIQINLQNNDFQDLLLTFNQIQLQNIMTDNKQQFIRISRTNYNMNFTVILTDITLYNIQSFQNNLNESFLSYQNAFIYIECYYCFVLNFSTERKYGVIELALINTYKIELEEIKIQQLENSRIFHPVYECTLQNLHPYVSFLIIAFYREILINKLFINNCYSVNYQILQIQGYYERIKSNEEFIKITNSHFKNNIILISDSTKKVGIIDIDSNQNSYISIQNVSFEGNILNNFIQSENLQSSATLLINLFQGFVEISSSEFLNNVAINSTNSNLFIRSSKTSFQNLLFESNNIINAFFLNKVNFGVSTGNLRQSLTQLQIMKYFPIKSFGGNGHLIQNQLQIQNIKTNNSFSNNGGAFYIQTNSEGIIQIENSLFIETMTTLQNLSQPKGGCFFIDSSLSNLNLIIQNVIINYSISENQGGAFFIMPSKKINYIQFQNMQVYDCFSKQFQFLSLIYPLVQDTVSNVLMENIQFYQTKSGFEKYLSQILYLEQEFKVSSMIYLNYGNFTMKNITFDISFLQYLLQLEKVQIVILNDIQILNSTYYNSPLISISLDQDQNNQLILQKIVVQKLKSYRELIDQQCLINNNLDEQALTCPIENQQNEQFASFYIDIDTSQRSYEQLICNKKLLFQKQTTINSLILLQLLGNDQYLLLENSKFDSINCDNCIYGIISIIFNSDPKKIHLFNLELANNNCGIYGCFYVSLNYFQMKQTEQQQSGQNFQIAEYSMNSEDSYYFILEKCQFINNNATFGGGLFLDQISILITDSLFIRNNAEKGGSIFYKSNQMKLQLINTQIIQNNAEIGGGLFIQNLVLGLSHFQNFYIYDNNATKGNFDISENPTQLTISLDNGISLLKKKMISNSSEYLIQQIQIQPSSLKENNSEQKYIMLPSGVEINQYKYFDTNNLKHIPLNLTFRIIALNQFNVPERQLDNSYCTINPLAIQKVTNNKTKNLIYSLSIQNVSFNLTSQDYYLDNLIINFNPQYNNDYFLRLQIECNMIFIPIIDENNLSLNYKKYQLYVDIQTYQCQIGEYLNKQTGGCILCDPEQNLYSLTKDSTNCTYRDNNLIDEFTSSTIKLRQFYWRAQNNSTLIEYCFHLEQNCEGGWIPGDNSCTLGHIGALCEQCDLYNLRGQGQYSINSQYSCGSCDKIIGNSIIIVIIIIWVLVSIYLSVNSTVQNIEQTILSIRLKFLGFTDSTQKTSTAILVKLFNNYLQIISIIQSLELKIPSILVGIYSGIGNPISQMSYSWDCFIVNLSSIDINYFRIIWSIFTIFLFINFFIVFEFLKQIFYRVKFDISHIYTALLYIFIYIHPSLIESLISQLSYREISNIKWIQGNVSYKYETHAHFVWIYSFILPLILLFGVLIPFYLFQKIYSNRNQLNTSKVKKVWGYLINEYKNQSYFWDIIKILQRQIIIIVFTYYQDNISIKGSLVVIILFSYSFLQANYQPYKSKALNLIEIQTIKVCCISITLGICIYSAQQYSIKAIQWLFYFLIAYLNIHLFFYFIFQLIKAYCKHFQKRFDHFYYFALKFFPKCILQHQYFQSNFQEKLQRQRKVKENFNKMRMAVLPIARQYLKYKNIIQQNATPSPSIEIVHCFSSSEDRIQTQHRIQTYHRIKQSIVSHYYQSFKHF